MKNSALHSLFRIGLLILTAASLSGCVGYQLGSMLPDDIRTVYVATFINETDEPLIETETTRAGIQEIQKDGSLRLVRTPEEADSILKVTLREYKLSPVGFEAAQKTTADEYRMTIHAALVLTRRSTGQVIAESPRIKGESTFAITGDFTSSKQRGLPLAATDLAHNLVEAMVESWP